MTGDQTDRRAEERNPSQEDQADLLADGSQARRQTTQRPDTLRADGKPINASRAKIPADLRSSIAQSASILSHRPDLRDFYDAKDALDGFRRAEKTYRRQMQELATWEDKDDVNLYYSLLSMKHRTKLLDILVPTRHCPLCNRFFEVSKSWVVLGINKRTARYGRQGSRNAETAAMSVEEIRGKLRGKLESNRVCAICRSCYNSRMHHKNHKSYDKYTMQRHIMDVVRQRTAADCNSSTQDPEKAKERKMINLRKEDLGKEERRYRLESSLLVGVREALDISMKEFSLHMGWSQAYQSKLERGEVETVTEEVFTKIIQLFEKHGAKFVEESQR